MIIVTKLGLGANFVQSMLHVRRNGMGVKLIKLKTAIVMLVCKLCLKNKRGHMNVEKLISILEEKAMTECRNGRLTNKNK